MYLIQLLISESNGIAVYTTVKRVVLTTERILSDEGDGPNFKKKQNSNLRHKNTRVISTLHYLHTPDTTASNAKKIIKSSY